MPQRKTILATGEVYHIFNRSIHKIPIFKGKRECQLFLDAIKYYLQKTPPVKYSLYRISRDKYPLKIKPKQILNTVICYCLMPSHFHFILRQEKEDGIRKFIQRVTNSFAHYYNLKYESRGPVFEGKFKAIRVDNDEQLIHLSRYIHLNPSTSYLVEDSIDYPYSSYRVYLKKENSDFINPSLVMNLFSSVNHYQKFIMAQKDYQRSLDKIKHLIDQNLV